MGKKSNDVEVLVEENAATPAGQTIMTKTAMMSGILAAMEQMSNDQLMQWYADSMELAAPVEGNAPVNQASIQTKGATVNEDVVRLFDGEELTESGRERVETLIEHAVSLQTRVERARLEEEFNSRLAEGVEEIRSSLIQKIDDYATYAAEQWVEKNEVAIESSVRVARADRLVEGLTALLAECGVRVEEGSEDALAEAERRVAELQAKLDEQVDETVAARRQATSERALRVLREESEGLTVIEREKLRTLVEDLDVDGSAEDLAKRVRTIREAHFKKAGSTPSQSLSEAIAGSEETLTEDEKPARAVDPRVQMYADAISRASGNRYARGVAR